MTDLAQQIRELYERDQRNRSPAVRATELPLAYELTTPEWWTDVLCQKHKGAKVVSYTLDEPDDGSAQRRRVFLEYNAAGEAAGLPSSVFCKASHSLRHRINLGVSGAAHSEVSFYRHIRPEMALEIPDAYFAAYDPDSFNSMVVLSDIGDEVEFCRHWTNIDRRRVEGQVQLMARYRSTRRGSCIEPI